MKHIDVTSPVMKRIALYERGQVKSWYRKYRSIIILLYFGIIVISLVIGKNIIEFGTLDLFSLLLEDKEIIQMYWNEVFGTLLQELPVLYIGIGLLFLTALLFVFYVTRYQRRVLKKKVAGLDKYLK